MKKLTLLTTILLTATVALGQGVAINETGVAPDPSAMLDVTSTSKGLLVPRMTIAQRNAIVLPNPGLLIFQTDATPGFYYNANTASSPNWQRLGDGSAGQWTISGDNISYNAGNVGIGTNTPVAQLHTLGLGTGQGNVLFTGEIKTVSPGNPPATGPGTRLMWYPDKAAFRSGQVTGTQWDKDNIGHLSSAWGENNKANGMAATAFGTSSGAAGLAATAWGSSVANGDYSTTWGFAYADGASATAWGESEANGDFSTTWGIAVANGNYATAWGSSQAQGIYATAWGVGTTAPSYAETALGRYNEIYSPFGPDVWDPIDRLFVIGNGNSHMQRANALTVLKNGRIGMGISQPLALLHTHGIGTGEGNVLFTGQFKSDAAAGNPPVTGAGTRMMWYPDKAAFRAGYVIADQWNKDNIGFHSFAMGSSNKASGRYSAAWGTNNNASGQGATAWGYINNATGEYSTAWGDGANASGKFSTAWGRLTSAPSFAETVIGQFNLVYTPASATSWNANDRLFVVANGVSAGTRSNAVTVMKSGNVGIGTTAPEASALLDVESTSKGFLPPRMTESQRDAISSPAEGLLITCTDCTSPGLHQYINGTWKAMMQKNQTGEYGTVVNPVTGKVWLDRNLGATQVATSPDDPASYGDLYQWGRAAEGHQVRTSPTIYTQATTWVSAEDIWMGSFILWNDNWLNSDVTDLWSGTSAENNPCPSGFRVPTSAEWNQERLTWNTNDAAGAFASQLKLPVAGRRSSSDGSHFAVGSWGYYWSSTVRSSTMGSYSYTLFFNNSNTGINYSDRVGGRSVRCIKD
ncbi:MAG: hypothetical protein ACNA7V_07340 [Bacteroidales bacterium]